MPASETSYLWSLRFRQTSDKTKLQLQVKPRGLKCGLNRKKTGRMRPGGGAALTRLPPQTHRCADTLAFGKVSCGLCTARFRQSAELELEPERRRD